MSDFYEEILIEAVRSLFQEIGAEVVVQEIAGDSGSLCFPVAPDTHPAMMDVISAEGYVDGSMELDSCDLSSAELLHVIDVMDVVILDDRENASHSSYNAGLFAMVDVTSSDDVSAYGLLGPAVILRAAYRISLHLSGALKMLMEEVVVVVFLRIVTEGNAAALRSVYITVFDDPAL